MREPRKRNDQMDTTYAVSNQLAGRGQPGLGRARLATGGRAGLVPRRFLEQHPLLAEMLEDSAKLGVALCIFFATRRLYPLQRLVMK